MAGFIRKLIVSILGLVCLILFDIHAIYASGLMLGIFSYSPYIKKLGVCLMVCLLIHASLSLPFVVFRFVKSRKIYARLNFYAIVQYTAGILIIVFLFYHTFYLAHKPDIVKLLIIIFTAAATGIHMFTGLAKSFVTLGLVREENGMKTAKTISFFITVLPALFTIAAFIYYYPQFYPGG